MLRLSLICLFFLIAGGSVGFSAEIDWHVKQPFRYFTETSDFGMQREAMADVLTSGGGTGATPVSDLERLINDPRWLREWYKGDTTLYPNVKTSGRPERGWANPINLRRATCWNSRTQWHSSCASDSFGAAERTDYVLPQAHTVIFNVKDAPSGTCRWQAERTIFIKGRSSLSQTIEAACGADVPARIPFEPELPDAQRGVTVSVTLPEGTSLTAPSVWVRDRLVVGFGDSYSSGEGNPDTPAEIDPLSYRAHLNMAFVYDETRQAMRSVKSNSLPIRTPNGAAGWVDRKCHRSAYSYHLRTALQIALADPRHSAVTFLGYACSGAEITEGFLLPYKGVETIDPGYFSTAGARRRDMPQLDRLMIELCKDDLTSHPRRRTVALDQPVTDPRGRLLRSLSLLDCPASHFLRPIDMLIISVGGNDVGFTPLIVDVLTKTRPAYADFASQHRANDIGVPLISAMARLMKAHGVDVAEKKARELPARFAALRKALAPLPIRSVDGKPNIILTAFPKIEFDRDGRLCGEAGPRERMEGFNVGGMLSLDVPELRLVSHFANEVLYPAIRQAAAAGNWHFVDKQRDAFLKHGICAQKRTSSVSAAENLMLPYYYDPDTPKWRDFEPFSAYREGTLNPLRDTRPYAPRERWFRTMNDICLFVQFKANGSPPPAQRLGPLDLLEACLGGPFHPTAEGHAHIADAVYDEASQVLRLPIPTAASVRP